MTEDALIRDPLTLAGARVFLTTTTSLPDYGVVIQPQRITNPLTAVPNIPVGLNVDHSRTFTNLTTTALGAGSAYTSGSYDSMNYQGAGIFIRSDQPVSLEIQESYDGTTFARGNVFYLGEGPGRTFHGVLIFPLAQRYFRVVVTNIGYATQTTFRVDRITYALASIKFISHKTATVERTTTTLAAGATYTSRIYTAQNLKNIKCYVYADQPGTLYYDVSFDGSTWRTVKSVSLTAGATIQDFLEPISGHFVRLRYVNGATAQSAFDFTIAVENTFD